MRTVAALLVATQLCAAAPARSWQTATLTETHRQEADTKYGKVIAVQFYTLDAGDRLIVCSHEVSVLTGRGIDIDVGSNVNYARLSTSRIAIQDSKGKEHKLTIEQETLKHPDR